MARHHRDQHRRFRGGVLANATKDYVANYKGIGIDASVDFEAFYAGMGFDDVRNIASKTGLEATMILEEKMIIGGNTSVNLGTTPTPTVVGATTGGSLATQTLSVILHGARLRRVYQWKRRRRNPAHRHG